MRLLKITNFYPGYLSGFYDARPELTGRPYGEQFSALMADCFSWADFWAVALRKLGYEADEVVANVEPMQKRWAEERGVKYDEGDWQAEIAVAQVKAFAPDILFSANHAAFGAQFLRRLKSECPSIRLVVGWCGAPFDDPSVFREHDIVLSCVPELVEHFLREGHRCHHVNHAFEPRVLERINLGSEPTIDFSFIGSVVKRDQYHVQREKLLLELVRKTDLQLWAGVNRVGARERYSVGARQLAYDAAHGARQLGLPESLLRSVPVVGKAARWKARPALPAELAPEIARRAKEPLYGVKMYQTLRDSRVVLNTHIDISTTSASNMRLFEVTGVGSCLLTDWKENITDLFEPGSEVVTYKSAEECVEKVSYLLGHERERRAIAEAGQRRTLRDHTIPQRAAQLDEIIRAAV
ncbi:MAG TPA: glycosyltransferase [Pyrinomonadaceae bacterium]|nr:glycosyltransferase [Pyrinomonadaceae bacterium]